MVTPLLASVQVSNLHPLHRYAVSSSLNRHRRSCNVRCSGENSAKETIAPVKSETEPENVLLKAAWYGSELLGIAASFLRSPSNLEISNPVPKLLPDEEGAISRVVVVETIKEDFQRSYFVTGNLTLDAYEENCEFADPAGSFRGLRRFKRNCTNFGSLIKKSNMKLMKWEDFEDRGIGHWRFSCVLSFPWKPILSVSDTEWAASSRVATGYTEYFFDTRSGKVSRHVEHWNVPKMTLLKQILRPSRSSW